MTDAQTTARRAHAFLKRFTVFNIDQCEGLPETLTRAPEVRPEIEILPAVAALSSQRRGCADRRRPCLLPSGGRLCRGAAGRGLS